jgi:propanediol dehydratase large subunit
MTKIKDLVTVIVDSAYGSFPIDAERYELCSYMNQQLNAALGRQRELFQITDESLKRFYLDMEDMTMYALVCTVAKAGGVPLSKGDLRWAKKVLAIPSFAVTQYPRFEDAAGRTLFVQFHKFCIFGLVYQKLAKPLSYIHNGP